jgi:hypothetical protein
VAKNPYGSLFQGPNYTGGGATQPLAPEQAGPSRLQSVLDILGSKGGQTAVAAVGAGLSAYGQNKQDAANRAQNANQFAATMAQRELENNQGQQLARSTAAAGADPLGASQGFAQKQAIFGELMKNARNFQATPGDPAVAGAMGSLSGGMRLPEGGFDPQLVQSLFGPEATMASIAHRQKQVGQINPGGPSFDMGSIYGDAAQPLMNDITSANKLALEQQQADAAKQREIIQRALDNDLAGEKQAQQKKGNIFGKILKGASIGAGFIPGVGQVLSPALSFAGGMVDGDGFKSSALNAGMSAIPGLAAGGKLGANAAKFAKSGAGKVILNGVGNVRR